MKIVILLALLCSSCALQTDYMALRRQVERLEVYTDSISEEVERNSRTNEKQEWCYHRKCTPQPQQPSTGYRR